MLDSARIALFAEILWSGPICFCNSPIAITSARRALAWASSMAEVWLLVRTEMDDKLSKPTAMTASRTIMLRETTRAKPLENSLVCWDFMG